MPVLESFLTTLITDLLKKGIIAGFEAFTSSKYNEYEKELVSIIEYTIEEYKVNNSIKPNGKIAFYESQALIDELVRFRFTKELDLEKVRNNLGDDTKIQMPTKGEIEIFLGIFSSNIHKSKNLNILNISNNYQEEIFNVSEKLDKLSDKILSEISSIKNQLSQISSDNGLTDEWSRQLDEISENIEAFKPKTALERLENLEKAISKKGISHNGIEGRLMYLKASCLTTLGDDEIKQPHAGLYLQASSLLPNNIEFKVNAAISYYVLGEILKAENAASEILLKDEFHYGGWIVKCYLSEDKIFEFLKSVPMSVRENKSFKRNLTHWLTAKKRISEITEVDDLGLGFDVGSEKAPDKINSRNIGYWVLVINYLLNKLYYEHPTLGGNGPEIELYKNPAFPYLKNLLRQLVSAVSGTEVEEKYNWHKFVLLYYDFMTSADIKSVSEIEKIFAKIKKKGFAEYIQMVQVLNSLNHEKEKRRATELIDEFGEEKHEILCLFNSFNKLELGDYEGSLSSFKHFLDHNQVIDEKAIFNIFAFTNIIVHVKPEKLDEVNELILSKKFKTQDFNELYKILRPNENERKTSDASKVKSNVDSVRVKIPNTNNQLRYFVALAYYNYGFYDEVVEYLGEVIDKTKLSNELKLYCLSLSKGNGNKLELLENLKVSRELGHKDFDLIALEITLRQTVKDWKKVLDITRYGLLWYPNNERLLYTLFFAYEKLTDVEGIKQDSALLLNKSFDDENLAINLSGILQRAGIYDEAIRVLYEVCSRTANPQIRQHYILATAQYPTGIFNDLPKAEIDSYVKYIYQDRTNIVHLTEESVKTFPGCVLVEKLPQEKFMWKRSMSEIYVEGTVIRIMNKYLALFEEILMEAENPAKGYDMEAITIEGEFDIKKFHEKLVTKFGYQGTSNKNKVEEILDEYYNGKISFSEVCKSIFQEDCIEAYYFLTFKAKLFKGISSGISTDAVIDDNTKFVLDFTSLCLFFELHQEQGLNFSHKFVISAFIVNELNKRIEETKLSPEEKMSVQITMEGVTAQRYEKEYKQKRLEFLGKLKEWINTNCEIDNVDEKLNILGSDKEIINDEYILYLTDNRLLTDRKNHILLTNDVAYYRHMKGNTNDIVSPEKYLKSFFAEKMTKVTNYMLYRNYVGIEINMELLQEEYVKSLSGKENRFLICLENLHLRWNPHLSHIDLAVQFLKWLYLANYISVKVKRPMALTVMVTLLKGVNNKNHINSFRESLKKNFELMGDYYTEIQIILLEALKIIKGGV